MDCTGNNDLRKHAGLGTCSCCDYFIFNEESVFLIEETQLTHTVNTLRSYSRNLDGLDRQKFIKKQIKMGNQLKLYGSMLVLCRLAAVCRNVSDALQGKSYVFWLVASGEVDQEDHIYFESLRNQLFIELRGQLTRELVEDVKVLPSDRLEQVLIENRFYIL